jgi:hypothetical protein
MGDDMSASNADGIERSHRTRLLHIYLNDHRAASLVGSELARRCRDSNRGTPLAHFLDDLLRQIQEDRQALDSIMDALGAPKSLAKLAGAWLAEKAGRLKLNGQLVRYSDLSRLLELEALALGIQGKGALWRSLIAVADDYPPLAAFDLASLERRAAQQLASLEEWRSRAAGVAFRASRITA